MPRQLLYRFSWQVSRSGSRYTVRMNEAQSQRFHHLRQQVLQGVTLAPDAAQELAGYMKLLQAEERALLEPAREAQEARIADTEERIAQLRQLMARREALVTYLRRVNEEVNAERDAISGAFQQLFGTTNAATTSVR